MASRELTRGSIPRHLIALAVPVVGAMLLQSVYALVDLAWVSRLGEDAVAGLSISLQVFFVILAVSQILGTTALADISHAWGAGRRSEADATFSTFALTSLLLGLVSALTAWLGAEAYVSLFTDDAAVLREGLAYFQVNALTFFTQLVLIVLGVGLRAAGDFTTPVRIVSITVLVNLVLDPLLIFGGSGWPAGATLAPLYRGGLALLGAEAWPGMGIAGAAWATVASQSIALVTYVAFFLARQREGRIGFGSPRFSAAFFKHLITRGLPAGLQFLLLSAVLGIVLAAMKPWGAVWTATAGGGFRVLQQAILPMVALGTAAAAMAGQNAGARNHDRIRATCRIALGWALGYALAAALLMMLGGGVLGRLFAQAEDLHVASTYFLWSAPALVGFATSVLPTFVMQALRRPVLPMLAAVFRILLLAVLVFVVVPSLGLGPEWVFGAATLAALVEGVIDTRLLWGLVEGLPQDHTAAVPIQPASDRQGG